MSTDKLKKLLENIKNEAVTKRKDVSPKTGVRKYGKDSEVNFADECLTGDTLIMKADQTKITKKIDTAKKKFGIGEGIEPTDLRFLVGKAIDAYEYFKVSGKNLEGTVGGAIRYEQHLDSLKDLLSVLDSPEFTKTFHKTIR